MILNTIIDFFFNLCRNFLDLIYSPNSTMYNTILYYIDFLYDFVDYAMPIYDFAMPTQVVGLCIDVVIYFETSVIMYKIVMWILTKIPFLGVKD